MKAKLLVVDDEKNIREGLQKALNLDGYDVEVAADGMVALEKLDDEDIDLVITDLKMPQLSGEELMKDALGRYPYLPIIILTGHGTIENAVEAMRNGAYDFITKPLNIDKLSLIVKRALENSSLKRQNRELLNQLRKKYSFENIIGKSTPMKKVFETIELVAPSRANVLIYGESGTGKEMIADAIHHNSPREDKSYIKVHCAALPESLLESELFGHEKGAFTGAISRKRGRFELAHLGTLFLDEVGEIPPQIQVKLLRVIQEREFERVGGEQPIKVDVRIISATNKNLKEEVEQGNFREDLYYRLDVVSIHVPPLRDKKDDIPLMTHKFIEEFSKENNKEIEGITNGALQALMSYKWPGNVRELRNVIESIVVLTKASIITEQDLPQYIMAKDEQSHLKIPAGVSLAEAEKRMILFTLQNTGGNKTKASEMLKIGRKTLHRKLNEYGIA
ncbi:MAG: sigma-54-dependent Fis family transcriptional regulator [Spirochaetota bacterium]|nr:MAG: sigma-54-dependent Fis family transcriptional regulator [Spirochaetota bacterium]